MAGFSVPSYVAVYQGALQNNAKVYVYQTGTTTLVTVYADGGLVTPTTNPVICDSNGEAKFYVSDATALRFYVTTSGGSLIEDIDPVYPIQNLSSSLALNAHGQCQLTKVGANLVLSPFNGNRLIINGQGQTVPAAGVSLAPSALTPGTMYFIYAYMSGTAMTLEASTTGHATDTSTGVEIKSGDPTRTFVGTATIVTGPAWAASVASWFNRPSGTVLLGTVTVSGSTVLDLNSLISSTYNEYRLVLEGVFPATNNTNLVMLVSTNNGSSYLSSGYYYDSTQVNSGATGYVTGSAASSALLANGLSNANAANYFSGSFDLTITSGLAFHLRGMAQYRTSAGVSINMNIAVQNDNPSVNGLRFQTSSGNITGTARLYGITQ